MAWAFGGGLFYTLGALADYFGWPVLAPGVFGSHEMLHVLDLCGSCCHVYFMVHNVVPFPGHAVTASEQPVLGLPPDLGLTPQLEGLAEGG